jgi:hypothetical protein
MRWWAYVAAQTALIKRRQRAIDNSNRGNWSWEHYSYEIAALEGQRHSGAIGVIV